MSRKKRIERRGEAEPVVTESVEQRIRKRLETLERDKKTAISWRSFKRQILPRHRKP
jgi:hypothetical protein